MLQLKENIKPYGILLIFCIITHGMLLLNDGNYWDGSMLSNLIQRQQWMVIKEWHFSSSVHYAYFLFFLLGHIWNPNFLIKALSFLSLYAISCCSFYLAKYYLKTPTTYAIFVAACTISLPIYYVLVSIVHFPYVSALAVFLLSWLLYLNGYFKNNLIHMVLAIILLTYSFNYNSLLVFHYGFICLFLYLTFDKYRPDNFVNSTLSFLKKNLIIFIMPIVFFILKRTFFKTYGLYNNYNQVTLFTHKAGYTFLSLIMDIRREITRTIANILTGLYLSVQDFWPIFILATFCIAIAIRKYVYTTEPRNDLFKITPIFFLGALLLIAAVLPYAAVGALVTSEVWTNRHAFLMGLPIALLLLSALELIRNDSKRYAIGLIIVSSFVFITFYQYITMQVCWIIDRSVIEVLHNIKPPTNGTTILTRYFNEISPLVPKSRSFYSQTLLFSKAWPGEKFLVIPVIAESSGNEPQEIKKLISTFSRSVIMQTGLENYRSNNCTEKFYFFINPDISKFRMTIYYFYYKFTHSNKLEPFLMNIVSLQQTKNCIKNAHMESVNEY